MDFYQSSRPIINVQLFSLYSLEESEKPSLGVLPVLYMNTFSDGGCAHAIWPLLC